MSFLCSLWEACLYSIPQSRIEALRAKGVPGAERLAKLRENIEEPIAAILTFNTLSHTLGATLSGGMVVKLFPEHEELASAIFGFIFLMWILIFTEIIPKTWGVLYSDKLAPIMAMPIQITIWTLLPLVRLCQVVAKLIGAGKGSQEASSIPSEQEIMALAAMGAKQGTLSSDEAKWISNALKLGKIRAVDLMTPRTVVYLLPADLPLSMVTTHSEHWTHSRLPVVQNNNPDAVEGVVYRRDVFDALVHKEEDELKATKLRDLMRAVEFVPEGLSGHDLLKRFLATRQQMFIVSNEYGGMEGVITLEDVLEYLLGEEIVDVHDKHRDMQEYARMMAMKRGAMVVPQKKDKDSKKD